MAKKKKRGRPPKKKGVAGIKPETLYSLFQLVSFLASGLILVSFSRQGSVLVRLNDLLVREFSWTTIFLPFIFLALGFLLSKVKSPLGQPNVFIGISLFFVSLMTISRAGNLGHTAWQGVATLITSVGAFIVLLGSMLVGIVVLFNTSVDNVLELLIALLKKFRGYLIGEKNTPAVAAGGLKVIGGNQDYDEEEEKKEEKETAAGNKEKGLEEKLVSNIPGEDRVWKHPPLSLLEDTKSGKADRGDIKGNAEIIEKTLESFGVIAKVVEVNLGPTVTQYALEVALGTKLSKVTNLERDLALALAAPTGTIRIEAPIPGRSLVGIELPNRAAEVVPLKKILTSKPMKDNDSRLVVSLGLDVSGNPVVANLGKMPHVLIAGQTGSGKSVALNTFLTTMLFRATPSEVKLILVDPKRVELTGYNGIPHLLSPVIVDPEKVISALRWIMSEMDRRYKLFSEAGARNIEAFNEMSGFQALPYIILVIDELADVMLYNMAEVEDAITRIAQMSRATGIHMVLATQRPSTDVITGLIKANIPSRIAFAVASQIDSRVILDSPGAEKLLGKGDMLYLPPEQAKPTRIQGAYISDKDINTLVSYLKNQGVKPQYTDEVTEMPKPGTTQVAGMDEDLDELFPEAVKIICKYDRASASLLQRRLSVGYARAARILDQLHAAGVVGAPDGSKPREVLIKDAEDFLAKAGVS